MKKTGLQTIKFSSGNNSNVACHITDENASNGNLNINSQSNSFGVFSSNLLVKVEQTTHNSGSSAIATRNITNYPWDLVYIPGNLVAVHPSGNFIAYAIKAPRPPVGMVRIMCRSSGVRGLIKNVPGLIKDLSFACLSNRVLLAFTDQYGTLYVYVVHEPSTEEGSLRTELLVEIKRNENEEASDYQRVIWCPFIPDEPSEEEQEEVEEENFAYLLVVTNGPLAEIWHIMNLTQEYGSGSIEHSKVKPGPGHQVMEQHSAPISDAAFSPDGTALATASLDGYVKFFQVYMTDDQSSPRCLHQWNPHDGKPLSCLFFLDNHKNPSPDVQFWKYAVTGACNNSEIKVWSCETWQCNQTISFECSDELGIDNASSLSLKAAIDPSSKYLLLSDIHRRVLYVLILYQEITASGAATTIVSNGESLENSPQIHGATKVGMARIISLSELPIQYPAMFLAIVDAEWKPYKRWKHEHLGHDSIHDHQEYGDEDSDSIDIVEGLVLKCVLINTKSLQEATIRFQPVVSLTSNFDHISHSSTGVASGCLNLSSSQDSLIMKDGLTDLSLNISSSLSEIENASLPMASLRRQSSEDAGRLDKNAILFPSKPIPVSMNILASNSSIVSTSSPHSSLTSGIVSSVIGNLSAMNMNDSITPMSLESSIPPLHSPILTPHGGALSSNIDVTPAAQQPVTLNLLTPESFSSPGRVDDDELTKIEEDFVRATECAKEKLSKRTPSPSEDLKSAALSLLLCVNSGSRHETSEGRSCVSMKTPKSQSSERSILESAVSGSSRSPPVSVLPPPPRTGPSPLPNKEDAPLATSEVSPITSSVSSSSSLNAKNITISSVGCSSIPNVSSGFGLASSTSSPSLEVQQILHSHNTKNLDDFADEDEDGIENEIELAMGEAIIQYKKKSLSDISQCLIDIPQPPPSSLLPSQSSVTTTSPQSMISPKMLSSNSPYTLVSKSLSMPPTSSLSPHSHIETSLSSPQVLQNLINMTAASNSAMYETKNESPSQQTPLIDMFAGLKSLHPPGTNKLTCSLIEAEIKHASLLADTSAASAVTSEGWPVYSLSYIGQKEMKPSLSLLKAIPAVKNHLTCEQLEAEIKCASPTSKKSSMQNLSTSSSLGSLSTLTFPMNLTPLPSNYISGNSLMNAENEGKADKSTEVDGVSFQKSMEEIASLRQLVLSCDNEQDERMKALLDCTRTLSNQIDKSSKNMHHLTKIVEDLRKTQTKMQEQLPNLISTSTRPILEGTIRQEMRNSLTLALSKCLDPIRSQINSEVRSLVSNSEMHLSESLSKAVYSRTFIDNLSSSVSAALAVSVQNACRDAYNKVVVPGFNAITQQMFAQLNDAFTRGTKEYMQHVETESQNTRTTMTESITKSCRSLETSASSLSTHSTTLMEAFHKNVAQQTSLSDTIGERLRHLIHDEIARALQEHAAVEARTSRAQTPAPTSHTPTNPKVAQQQVQQLISQGQFNHAFKQALSASDLSLVVFVCERINPQQLFSQTPCPLSQEVLLSLVNQLSHDLNTFTDLKTKYLEESVMNLDTNHPVTREHMRTVLQGFQRCLSSHLALNPNHKKLKMLLLAVNHLVSA